MTQLVTGEAVALDLRPAALPSRLVAAAIDASAQAVLLTLLLLALSLASGSISEALQAALTIVFLVLAFVGYPVLFESLWRGRTPGKAAMGLRVVRDDGGPVAFRQSLVRGLASLFLERPGITLFTGAVITSLLHPSSKRLGDLLAGTLVLQERVPSTKALPVPMPPQLATWAAELDLGGLTDDLAGNARAFVVRAPQLTAAAREDLGGKIVAAVGAVVSPPAPAGTPGWAYLAAVLAERRRRAELRYGAEPAPVPLAYGGTALAELPAAPEPVSLAKPIPKRAPGKTVAAVAAPATKAPARKAPAKKATAAAAPAAKAPARKAVVKTPAAAPTAPAAKAPVKTTATAAASPTKAPAKKAAARTTPGSSPAKAVKKAGPAGKAAAAPTTPAPSPAPRKRTAAATPAPPADKGFSTPG